MTDTPDTTPAEAPPDDVEEYISAAEAIHRLRCRHRQHSKPNAEDYKLAMLAVEAAAPVIAARATAVERAKWLLAVRKTCACDDCKTDIEDLLGGAADSVQTAQDPGQ